MAGIRTRFRLTAKTVEKLQDPGVFADGAGLSLIVTAGGVKRWELRISAGRRRRQLGLGVFPAVSLEQARQAAADIRRDGANGYGRRIKAIAEPIPQVTFRQAFESYFELKEQQLSNFKHAAQWRSTMTTYVFPKIGRRPIADITAAEIIDILKPIWNSKPETAKRVLQRMRSIFEAAIVRGDRQTAAPTTGVKSVLGTRPRSAQRHHAALPFGEVPAFVASLQDYVGWPATKLALEFLILTAARSNEVRAAAWEEMDFGNAVWTVPASRMKAREPHAVPLSNRAVELLRLARTTCPEDVFVFPGVKPGRPLCDMTMAGLMRVAGLRGRATPHSFRSSFKDWCAEVAQVRDEVSEAALAHKSPNKVRAAYLRTTFFDERRVVMQRWSDFVSPGLSAIASSVVNAADAKQPSALSV